jgi:hypothetical protein
MLVFMVNIFRKMNELEELKNDIVATKARLTRAEEAGNMALIESCTKLLAGYQEKENRLSQTSGNLVSF